MEEEIEVVAFACRGTLLDWAGAIEAVAYELARANGESPLDRGAALRRRVEALADGHGLARGFERLARERGYRGEESGEFPGALYLFGGAFDAVLGDLDPGRIGAASERVLYVTASPRRRKEARALGMRAVAPGDLAGALEAPRPDARALGVATIERHAPVAA
jgi:FMN phosphatase YigB (HAD superfamily)